MSKDRRDVNETSEMWKGYHAEMRERSEKAGRKARYRIMLLEASGQIKTNWHTLYHVTLTRPGLLPHEPERKVEFYPTRGTIVRLGVREDRRGLDAALRMLGVRN